MFKPMLVATKIQDRINLMVMNRDSLLGNCSQQLSIFFSSLNNFHKNSTAKKSLTYLKD